MPPTEIKGFHILPVRLPESARKHYMYFRKHETKTGQDAYNVGGRLLFVFNVPIATTLPTLKKYFQQVAIGATVEKYIPSVLTDSTEETFFDLTKLSSNLEYRAESMEHELSQRLPPGCGIVTFIDKASLQLALNLLKKCSADRKTTNWPMPTLGSQYLFSALQSRIHDHTILSKSVASALADFNRAEQESREELKKQSELVDEDGFTLVVGPHSKTKVGMMGVLRLATDGGVEKAKKKKNNKEKEDFYRFQLRERKKAEMNDLLRKFKQDQERIRTMKEKKRFRPY